MSSKQTRRSISVRGTTYVTLRQYCEEHDRSMSDLVEELLAKVFAASAGVTPIAKAVPATVPAKSVKMAKPVAAPQAMAAKILRAAPPAAKAAPPKAAPKPAPVPVAAAKPAPVAAAKPAPAKAAPPKPMPAPPAAGQNGSGRPAPTPAKAVVADRVVAPKGDYRVISF